MRTRSDAEPAPPLPNLYEGLHLVRPQTPGSQGEERPPLELEDNREPIGTQMGRAADYNEFESFQASVWDNQNRVSERPTYPRLRGKRQMREAGQGRYALGNQRHDGEFESREDLRLAISLHVAGPLRSGDSLSRTRR